MAAAPPALQETGAGSLPPRTRWRRRMFVKQARHLTHGYALNLAVPQMNNTNLKSDLHDLYITAAREVDVDDSKKAIILFVPHKLLPKYVL